MEVPVYFKYCPPERIDILRNMEIRYAQPVCFNDPFETAPAAKGGIHTLPDDQRQSAYDEFRSSTTLNLDASDKAKSRAKANESAVIQLRKYAAHETGILSLSKRWDNPLMWASYSRDYKGFVIGFLSFFTVPFGGALLMTSAKDINYTKNRPEIDMEPFIQILGPESYKLNFDAALAAYSSEIFFAKSEHWKHEQEVRVVCTFHQSMHRKIDAYPYPIYLYPIHKHELCSIIIGINTPDDLAEELATLGESMGLKVFRCFKYSSTYGIGLWDIATAQMKRSQFGDKNHIGYNTKPE